MNKFSAAVGIAAVLAVSTLAGSAGATTYNTLYIHGRTTSPATPSGSTYWNNSGGTSIAKGSSIVYVNYNGNQHISQSNPTVTSALNTYCTGTTACVIACHSAGCSRSATRSRTRRARSTTSTRSSPPARPTVARSRGQHRRLLHGREHRPRPRHQHVARDVQPRPRGRQHHQLRLQRARG